MEAMRETARAMGMARWSGFMYTVLQRMMQGIERRAHRIGHVETYEVFADELGAIERGYSSRQNDLSLLGISLTVFVSFLLALIPYGLSPGPTQPREHAALWYWVHVVHVALVIAGGGFSLYFFFRWCRAAKREQPIFQRIKDRALEPVGQEGKEIKAAELEALPSRESAKSEA